MGEVGVVTSHDEGLVAVAPLRWHLALESWEFQVDLEMVDASSDICFV